MHRNRDGILKLCFFGGVYQIAKRQAVVNPENTFASVKRFIGRKMNEVKEESKQVPYSVSPPLRLY